RGLFDHPHRPRWVPGNGGLALHTILLDPANSQRMYVAISAGGVYRTDDGGRTWAAQNRGFGLCSCLIDIPSSGSVYTRSQCIPPAPNVFFCKTIGGCIAPMTMAKTGWTSLMACPRILALP